MEGRFRWRDIDSYYGNAILYRMCAEEPAHQDPEVVAGKIWLIGRAYAAQIERGSGEKNNSGAIYMRVAEAMCTDFDSRLSEISDVKDIDLSNVHRILSVHKRFVDILKVQSGRERRSFASKYLHFHRPQAFFIYDSQADAEIRRRVKGRIDVPAACNGTDPFYAGFAVRCIRYRDTGPATHRMTPRALDRKLRVY